MKFFFKLISLNISLFLLILLLICFVGMAGAIIGRDNIFDFNAYLAIIVYGILFVIFPLTPFTIAWNYFFYKQKEPSFTKVKNLVAIIPFSVLVLGFILDALKITDFFSDCIQKLSAIVGYSALSLILILYFHLLYKWVKPLYKQTT